MEFRSYKVDYAENQVSVTPGVKRVIFLKTLAKNCEARKKEREFTGLGSFLTLELIQKGQDYIVKIPFFRIYEMNYFVNEDGINFVSRLALKIIKIIIKNENKPFDFSNYKLALETRIQAELSSPNITLTRQDELKDYLDNVLSKLREKDSQDVIKENLAKLTENLKEGLDLRNLNEASRKKAIKKYTEDYIQMLTLKNQLNNLSFRQKKGLARIWNGITKKIAALITAIFVLFEMHGFTSSRDSHKEETLITTISKEQNESTQDLVNVSSPTISKMLITDERFLELCLENRSKFADLRPIFERNNYRFEDMIVGYTYVQNISEIACRDYGIIKEYISRASNFIFLLLKENNLGNLQLKEETLKVLQAGYDGNLEVVTSTFLEQKLVLSLVDELVLGNFAFLHLQEYALNQFTNEFFSAIDAYINAAINNQLDFNGRTKILH